MAANMLGADLESLTALSQRLDVMSTVVSERRTEAMAISTDVVAELDAAITRATSRGEDGLAALRSEIAAADSQTQSTEWTGGNQITFAGNQADFNLSLTGTLSDVEEAYSSFNAGLVTLSGQIDQLRESFSLNLTNAEDATRAMSNAVVTQRDALDSVMNSAV